MNENKKILIEGYTYQVNPQGTIVDFLISNLSDKHLDLILNRFSFDKSTIPNAKSLHSQGIKNILYIKDYYYRPRVILFSLYHFIKFITSNKNLINLRINDILIGDSIYDGILRGDNKLTIDHYSLTDYFRIFTGILDYHASKQVLKKNYSIVLTSHLVYSKFAILSRVAWQKKVPVVLLNATGALLYSNLHKNLYPHNRDYRLDRILLLLNNEKYQKEVDQYIEKRINGEIVHFDVKNSYAGDVLNLEDLESKLGVKTKNKFIVLIAAHAFKDGPHDSENLLYRDYFQWFKDTIRIVTNNPSTNILYLIKPHPSAKKYGEESVVSEMMEGIHKENILLLPTDISTKSIIEIVDLTVTVSGTIGIEFACFGIPTLITGSPFYVDFGFSTKPSTIRDYEYHLLNPQQFKRLDDIQVRIARTLFYYHINHVAFLDSPMLTDNKLKLSAQQKRHILDYMEYVFDKVDKIS